MKHIKELDVLRAFAVIMVLLSHWLPERNIFYQLSGILNGVDIFFVLSGFLITGILLTNRLAGEQNNIGKVTQFKNFVARRTLRIFPIYYAYILAVYILGPSSQTNIRQDIVYYLTYTSNFHFYNINRWDGMLSHLWSLAVEEQFYIIWPWLMLLLPKRWILPSILLFISIGIVTWRSPEFSFNDILTYSCFHAFGFGALLAWINIFKKQLLIKSYSILTIAALLALSVQVLKLGTGIYFQFPDYRTLTSVVTVWIITSVLLEKHRSYWLATSLLHNRILIFIGKISYGIYLFHLLIPMVSKPFIAVLNAQLPVFLLPYKLYLVCVENFLILLLLSWLSWVLVEKPILRFKKYFEARPGSEEKQYQAAEVPVIAVPKQSASL